MKKVIKIGDSASFSKTITEFDVLSFAGITGDFNPVHIDSVAANNSIFKQRIAHGMLTASFISTVIGMQLPGPGTIYLGQNLKFVNPVHIGDTITAIVKVSEIIENKGIYTLSTLVINQEGKTVIEGSAKILYR